MLTLLMIGLHFFVEKKFVKAAFFVGFSVMTKYMPVVFLPYFLLLGCIPFLCFVLMFIVMFNFMPAISFGLTKNLQLINDQLNFLFASSLDPWSIYCHANQSLLGYIARTVWTESEYPIQLLHLDKSAMYLIFFVLAGIMYALSVFPLVSGKLKNKASEEQKREGRSIDLALLFVCMSLFNPNAWMNFFVCLIFPYMTVFAHLIKRKGKDWLVLALTVFSFASSSWTSEEVVNWFAGDDFEILSSVTIGTISLFIALIILKLRMKKELRSI